MQFLNEDVLDFNWNDPNNDPIDLVSSKDTQPSSGVVSKLNNGISCDRKIYDQIHLTLTACPDFNNCHEYVVRNDGITRTALDTSALMPARIKLMLEVSLMIALYKLVYSGKV